MVNGLSLRVARYNLEFLVTQKITLPEYAGSALRGVFGHALRALSCMTGAQACDGCPMQERCSYTAVFAPHFRARAADKFVPAAELPVPYIVEPPAWGDCIFEPGQVLRFSIVLVGAANDFVQIVILAWQKALRRGIGRQGQAELQRVTCELQEVYARQKFTAASVEAVLRIPPTPQDLHAITLEFLTPLRLQQQGSALGVSRISADFLFAALMRRVQLMSKLHGTGEIDFDFLELKFKANSLLQEKHLLWKDWSRYSSRQDQKMTLGGVCGTWKFSGKVADFWELLYLGQWLHLGKNASFGLGRYLLSPQS